MEKNNIRTLEASISPADMRKKLNYLLSYSRIVCLLDWVIIYTFLTIYSIIQSVAPCLAKTTYVLLKPIHQALPTHTIIVELHTGPRICTHGAHAPSACLHANGRMGTREKTIAFWSRIRQKHSLKSALHVRMRQWVQCAPLCILTLKVSAHWQCAFGAVYQVRILDNWFRTILNFNFTKFNMTKTMDYFLR